MTPRIVLSRQSVVERKQHIETHETTLAYAIKYISQFKKSMIYGDYDKYVPITVNPEYNYVFHNEDYDFRILYKRLFEIFTGTDTYFSYSHVTEIHVFHNISHKELDIRIFMRNTYDHRKHMLLLTCPQQNKIHSRTHAVTEVFNTYDIMRDIITFI